MAERVAICCPTRDRPTQPFLDALERSVPHLDAAGFVHASVFEVGCPYVSAARATMLRKAMLWGADVFLFLDDDLSWPPEQLVKLLNTAGEVVAGTYRYKIEGEESYMGTVLGGDDDRPIVRADGAVLALNIPAGFLKVTRAAVERFMQAFPELVIDKDHEGFESPDLFNHGAYRGTWFGEDYAFSRRWREIGGEIWIVPDLDLDHHSIGYTHKGERFEKVFPGNFRKWLLRQPGGSESTDIA